MTKTLLVMAGGTGGHVFPGLAVADVLKARGWNVVWMGNPNGMEATLVPSRGYEMAWVRFGALRGKGLLRKLLLPFALLSGFWQARREIRRVKPDVVLGMGGYISFPGGMMAVLQGCPLVIHEQNSIAGLANRVLARIADRVVCGFPNALPKSQWLGNPVRPEIANLPAPAERFAARSADENSPLRLLVLGGSLGALLGAFASGRMVAHYFIPLVPPLLLLLWCTAERYAQAGRRRVRVTVIVLLAITVGLSVAALRISAQATLAQWRGGYQGSHADLQGKIADDIGNRPGHPPQSAWVLADSQSAMAISYLSRSQPANWLSYPAHYLDPKVTAAFGTSPQHELQVLFAAQPDFVVVGRGRYAPAAQYGAVSPAVLESFTTALTRDYTQARDYPDLAVGDGFVVYRRRTVDAD